MGWIERAAMPRRRVKTYGAELMRDRRQNAEAPRCCAINGVEAQRQGVYLSVVMGRSFRKRRMDAD